MMLNGMSMNDLAQFAGPTMERFEPLPCPLVRVFFTFLEKEVGSMLFLESCFAHGACVFRCTFTLKIVPLAAPPCSSS